MGSLLTWILVISSNVQYIPWNLHAILHYIDVIMTTVASQITSLTVVYSIVYSEPDQRKHQSSASLAIVRGIHRDRWIPRTKGQLRGKCFQIYYVIMCFCCVLLLFGTGMFYPYRSRLLHWNRKNRTITPVPVWYPRMINTVGKNDINRLWKVILPNISAITFKAMRNIGWDLVMTKHIIGTNRRGL